MIGRQTLGNRSTAAQPLNRSTAQPLNRSTAQPLNRSTAQPRTRGARWTQRFPPDPAPTRAPTANPSCSKRTASARRSASCAR
ncbi:hypothetical protein DF150_04660 [Burkholderia cenocepacia]|nr:hypothetical protein DF150_04660 [Burkholderia cenocepacia]